MSKKYLDLLKDPRWQKMRLKIFERDNWKCQYCGSTNKTLHVHHKLYKKGCNPWEYEDTFLITLCEKCHQLESDKTKLLNELKNYINFHYSPINIQDLIIGFQCTTIINSDFIAALIASILKNGDLQIYMAEKLFEYHGYEDFNLKDFLNPKHPQYKELLNDD